MSNNCNANFKVKNGITLPNGANITDTGGNALAIGQSAGQVCQGGSAIAIGAGAAYYKQSINAIAIGTAAGQGTGCFGPSGGQGACAIAIGLQAGAQYQGGSAIAIGGKAGTLNQANNTIIINATGSAVNGVSAQTCSFYVAPVRSAVGSQSLWYCQSSKEVTYAPIVSVATAVTVTASAQPNITSVGSLTSLSVTGNLAVGGNVNITGNITQITGNSGQFFGNNITGYGALYAGIASGYTTLPSTVLQIATNSNTYSQLEMQNINSGSAASSDYVVTADNGNDSQFFGDFGIASSTYNYPGLDGISPNDVYIIASGNNDPTYTGIGNLDLLSYNGQIKFFSGGGDTSNLVTYISNTGLYVSGVVSTTGNITGSYIIGNGSQLIGTTTDWANIGNINNANGPRIISIGLNAGRYTPSDGAIAIGNEAGEQTQGSEAIAIGSGAGFVYQGFAAVAIGGGAGAGGQGALAIALGSLAGENGQSPYAIAIGQSAGQTNQGNNSIAIGSYSGFNAQAANTIILNASGSAFNGVLGQANSFYVNPVRNDTGNTANVLYYNAATNEITYAPGASTYGNANVAAYLPTYSGNITAGNISATGTVVGGNILTSGLFSATGNIRGGNINTVGIVTATGNIFGNVHIGNGAGLTSLVGSAVVGAVASATTATSATSATTAGTVTANAQANITSVGTLTSLTASGLISTTGNVSGNVFVGNGAGLTSLVGSAVAGQVGNALVAGTVYTNAQPNITSVGTLTSLSVTGNINSGNLTTVTISATGNVYALGVVNIPIVGTTTSGTTITPTTAYGQYNVTALATSATIAIPTGTPQDGQKLTIRIKDNGTPQTLTWTTSAGGYRAEGITLPTTTVASTPLYVGAIYNAQDSYWDVVGAS